VSCLIWLLGRRPASNLHAICHPPTTKSNKPTAPAPPPTQTGYFGFSDEASRTWRGAIPAARDLAAFPPDYGPSEADPARGVLTLGAAPWIINFNVPVATGDLARCRRVARAVSERGGGLKGVEVRRGCGSGGLGRGCFVACG
jgi:hypothetical protein